MKKVFVATLFVVAVSTLYCTAMASGDTKFSRAFMKNIKDCNKYEETINSSFEGRTFTTHRKINGWKNGFCKYEETIKTNNEAYSLNCSLNGIQLEELYDSMRSKSKEQTSYELELFTEKIDPKTGVSKYVSIGTQTIKGDKAYISWAKIQNNPYFCRPEKLNK